MFKEFFPMTFSRKKNHEWRKKNHECRDRKRYGGLSNNVKTENFRRRTFRRLAKPVVTNY